MPGAEVSLAIGISCPLCGSNEVPKPIWNDPASKCFEGEDRGLTPVACRSCGNVAPVGTFIWLDVPAKKHAHG